MVSPFHSEDPENGKRRSRREQSSGNDAARPPPRKVEAAFFMSGEETSVEETIVNKSLLYAVFFGLTASPAFADSTIPVGNGVTLLRSEEHTSELQSLMRISYAV